MKQYIYAHRGASAYAPENTMRAFQLAADMRADGVELDVQLTRDRKIVVFHDETLERVTEEEGAVMSYTADQLRKMRVTMRQPGEQGEEIPLLSEVLSFLKEKNMQVNIELKNSVFRYFGMEELVLDAVAAAGMEDRVLYSSLNHYSMLRVKELNKNAPCGLLYQCTMVEPWRYAGSLGMNALHPQFSELGEERETREAHRMNIEVNPWTVDRDSDLRRVIALGADRIITNYPARARALMDEAEQIRNAMKQEENK